MTAVAAFTFSGYPFVVADFLISGPPIATTPVIPTVLDLGDHVRECEKYVPRGLKQKIALLSGGLVMGWSGRASVASDVIGELKMRMDYESYDAEGINRYLDGQGASTWQDLSLVGFVRNHDGTYDQFGRECWRDDTADLTGLCHIGKGGKKMRDTLASQIRTPWRFAHLKDVENLERQYYEAIGSTLLAVGTLHASELISPACVEESWGGGYEMAMFGRDGFSKLDDTTFLFWAATQDHDSLQIPQMPCHLLNYKYIDDALAIRSINFSYNESTSVFDGDERRFLVPPVYRELTPTEKASFPVSNLNAEHLCCYFALKPNESTGDCHILTTGRVGRAAEAYVQITEGGGTIGIQPSRRCLEDLQSSFRGYLSRTMLTAAEE
jgi:hypothetical protein